MMKLNQTLTALLGAGLLGLMSSPLLARSTACDLGTAANPPLVLAQETPAQESHEQQRYDEQMREDQHHNQEAAMHHSSHHRRHHYSHKHHKQPIHSEPGDNNYNGNSHEAH